jgi:hypothetical protein
MHVLMSTCTQCTLSICAWPPQTMLLQLAYLMSYEHMGVATVRCDSGCSCNDTLIDGHHKQHWSQVSEAPNSRAGACLR